MRGSILIIFFMWVASSFSQDTIVNQKFSSNILSFKNPSTSISFSGYYRFLGFVRNQQETFPNNSGKTLVISSGDNYREPMFLSKLNGKTKENITFGVDFMLNSLYKGSSPDFTQPLTLNLGLNISLQFLLNMVLLILNQGVFHGIDKADLLFGETILLTESVYMKEDPKLL